MAYSIQGDIYCGDSHVYSAGSPTNKWKLNGHVKEYIELTITLESSNGTSKTITDSRITAKHVVLNNINEELIGYKIVPN